MKQTSSRFVPVTITVTPEQISRMALLGKDRSSYIRNLIDNNLFTVEEIVKRQAELKAEIDHLELHKDRKQDETITIELNSNWIPYLENARATVERDPTFLKAQCDGFNNNFSKDISLEEFKQLLGKVKPKLRESIQK